MVILLWLFYCGYFTVISYFIVANYFAIAIEIYNSIIIRSRRVKPSNMAYSVEEVLHKGTS